jgi:hypothetical protein
MPVRPGRAPSGKPTRRKNYNDPDLEGYYGLALTDLEVFDRPGMGPAGFIHFPEPEPEPKPKKPRRTRK